MDYETYSEYVLAFFTLKTGPKIASGTEVAKSVLDQKYTGRRRKHVLTYLIGAFVACHCRDSMSTSTSLSHKPDLCCTMTSVLPNFHLDRRAGTARYYHLARSTGGGYFIHLPCLLSFQVSKSSIASLPSTILAHGALPSSRASK